MLPISDTTHRTKFPLINYLIIVATIAVFYFQLTQADSDLIFFKYGLVPSLFKFDNYATWLPVFTSIFLHGGIMHIALNLWFLRIFGDNVENALGHIHYLVFYLVGGAISVFAQYAVMSQETIPLIGASGAISAVSGAYFVYFRRSHVKTLVMTFVITIVEIPVWLFLGYWFLIQVVSGVGSLGSVGEGGVAFFAHIGGFVFGYLYAKIVRPN